MTAQADAAVTMRDRVESYISLRRALGHRLEAPERMLNDFPGWLQGQPDPRLTVDTVLGWATDERQARGLLTGSRIAYRVSVVRSFATYLTAFDPTVQVPPRGLVRPEVRRSAPYLFTPDEVQQLMAAAAALPGPLWSTTMTTLIGVMSATGMRTSAGLFAFARRWSSIARMMSSVVVPAASALNVGMIRCRSTGSIMACTSAVVAWYRLCRIARALAARIRQIDARGPAPH